MLNIGDRVNEVAAGEDELVEDVSLATVVEIFELLLPPDTPITPPTEKSPFSCAERARAAVPRTAISKIFFIVY